MSKANRLDQKPGLSTADRDGLVQLAYRLVWNRDDAEDAVQHALALAHEKRDQLREPDKQWSWLSRIVVRQCLLSRRQEKRRNRYEQAIPHEPATDAAGTSEGLERQEQASVVRWALEQLPDRQRTAVTLRHLESMPYHRIAQIMDITPSTARVHVRSAREAMRQAITKRFPEFGQPEESDAERRK